MISNAVPSIFSNQLKYLMEYFVVVSVEKKPLKVKNIPQKKINYIQRYIKNKNYIMNTFKFYLLILNVFLNIISLTFNFIPYYDYFLIL